MFSNSMFSLLLILNENIAKKYDYNNVSYLLRIIDLSQQGSSDETPLWVICESPYAMDI
jgi:hypothetical protein